MRKKTKLLGQIGIVFLVGFVGLTSSVMATSPTVQFMTPTAESVVTPERYDLGLIYPESKAAFTFQLPAGGSNAQVDLVTGPVDVWLQAGFSQGYGNSVYKGYVALPQLPETARLSFPFSPVLSALNNPLNVHGGSYIKGRYGSALHFDGDDYATFDGFSAPTGGVAMWLRPAGGASPSTIMSVSTGDGDGSQAFALRLAGSGELELVLLAQVEATGVFPAPSLWTHVAVSFDGVTGRIFVNGELEHSFAQTGLFNLSGCPVQLGRSLIGIKCGATGVDYFTGDLDDVAVYDQPVTIQEIQDRRYNMVSFETRLTFDFSGQSRTFFVDGSVPRARSTSGPLGHRPNDIYLSDPSGKAIYLTGSHTWDSLQDWDDGVRQDFDYSAYLDLLEQKGHNFFRLWAWESRTPGHVDLAAIENSNPLPWVNCVGQTVDCYDLYQGSLNVNTPPDFEEFYGNVKFNTEYFERLGTRVQQARERGIYVGVMLFQGHSVFKRRPTDTHGRFDHHPLNSANNLQGVHADTTAPGQPGENDGEELHTLNLEATSGMEKTVASFQKAYVRKVVETLNALDNVLWEISNESLCGHASYPDLCSFEVGGWQNQMTSFIREVESGLPHQHAVGITGVVKQHLQNNPRLFNSLADWISPGEGNSCSGVGFNYGFNPKPADGLKVLISDIDHIGCVLNSTDKKDYRKWTWTSMMRGINPILMDAVQNRIGPQDEVGQFPAVDPANPAFPPAREYLGDARFIADLLSLQDTIPDPQVCSTGFCMVQEGVHYAVYNDTHGQFSVNLAPGNYRVYWLNPSAPGSALVDVNQVLSVPGGGNRFFGGNTARPIPFGCPDALCDVVLFLETTALPDLLPVQANVDGENTGISVFPGQTALSIGSQIDNQGTSDLEQAVQVEVFFSQDAVWDANDLPLASTEIQEVEAGGSSPANFFVGTLPQVALGPANLLIVVDRDTQVAEANEGNNTFALPITVIQEPVPTFPPLEVSGVSLNKALIAGPYTEEVAINVSVPVGNVGASFYIDVLTTHNLPINQAPTEQLVWSHTGADDLVRSFIGIPDNHSGVHLVDTGIAPGVYNIVVTARRDDDTHNGQTEIVSLEIELTVVGIP